MYNQYNQKMSFTIGTDPEFFLASEDKIYSAISVLNADKYHPIEKGEFSFFADNVLAECNIPPSNSKEKFISNIRHALTKLAAIVHPFIILPQASCYMHKSQLKHPAAKEVGCKEECCAYTNEIVQNEHVEYVIKNTNLRCAGGHLHIGSPGLQESFVKLLDVFLALPFVLIDADDTIKRRRKIYGKAGRFRKPAYGIEYRTLNNYWLSSPDLVNLVYNLVEFTLEFKQEIEIKDLPNIINENNVDKAEDSVQILEKYLPTSLFSDIMLFADVRNLNIYEEWCL